MTAVTIDNDRPVLQRERRDGVRREAVRRSQLLAAFAVILAACAVWTQAGATDRTGSAPLVAPGAGPTQAVAAHVWVVAPGDTIWAIARQVRPSGDIRPLVDALSAETHGRPLEIGERLVLP